MPEPWSIPTTDTSRRPNYSHQGLDMFQSTAQPTLATDIEQIAMSKIVFKISIQSLANDRQIEACTIESHQGLHSIERLIEREIAHATTNELDSAPVRPIDTDHTDRSLEGSLDIQVGTHILLQTTRQRRRYAHVIH